MSKAKDICLSCGTEYPEALWGAECSCTNPNVVHQDKCMGCGRMIGIIIDDDYCFAKKLYCPECVARLSSQAPSRKEPLSNA